jgi:predicted permease
MEFRVVRTATDRYPIMECVPRVQTASRACRAAVLYFGILGTTEETTRVTLFEAAMGPQIGGAIVAVQHGLNPPLVSLMVGLGIPLSFLTLPLWSYALHHL